ncbi:MAG: peptidoglycan endopeptidase [Sphingomonadales bacterium]|nr:MAG: peptidoglycan endopeptidase [Sphingomonadales bacterium]
MSLADARATIGARFRLHGRDPDTGLDCIGLAAIGMGAVAVPTGYRLRNADAARVGAFVAAMGLAVAADRRAGDLLLVRPGPGQLHLAIDSGDGVIHADAVLRRVVERPGAIPWPVIGRWRRED